MISCTHRKEPQQAPLNKGNFLARGVNNIFQELCSMQLDGREVWKGRNNLMLLTTESGLYLQGTEYCLLHKYDAIQEGKG